MELSANKLNLGDLDSESRTQNHSDYEFQNNIEIY